MSTNAIRIISTPPGQAPEEVRQKWVGMVIPLSEQNIPGSQIGVLGGKPQNQQGYPVDTRVAIGLLRRISPEAVEWWEKNVPLSHTPQLVFSRQACELVTAAMIIGCDCKKWKQQYSITFDDQDVRDAGRTNCYFCQKMFEFKAS